MAQVRVRRVKENKLGVVLECLRYAGVISNVKEEFVEKGDRLILYYTFDIMPPQGTNESVWADMNKRRIQSFNIRSEVI